nr:MAG TPA: hypothetical protein [Caudoviricetes sp.]
MLGAGTVASYFSVLALYVKSYVVPLNVYFTVLIAISYLSSNSAFSHNC